MTDTKDSGRAPDPYRDARDRPIDEMLMSDSAFRAMVGDFPAPVGGRVLVVSTPKAAFDFRCYPCPGCGSATVSHADGCERGETP